ncbi:MAG: hypothetical protein QOJ85_3867 [Solirubrobacteraceae bacterium]|nr:hypothetical protein [Solirubrobacteraceae bacterium]
MVRAVAVRVVIGGWLTSLIAVLCLASIARAARIPTPVESAVLNGFVKGAIGGSCDARLSRPLPLIGDDATWGRAAAVCEHPGQGGAGIRVWGVWAHRSSAAADDWMVVGGTDATRVPPCTGKRGLFTLVPQAVVRDLREECYDPTSGKGYEPSPHLTLTVFRNAKHHFDEIGPWVGLSSLSDVNGRGLGDFSIDRHGAPLASGSTPTVAEMTKQFGKPRRTACRARWAKLALSATACASGRVTKLTLGSPWRLAGDEEDFAHSGNASVEVGDAVALARYLDPRLRKLRDNQHFRLPPMHIGRANITTITVLTRGGRIRAIEISLRRARSASTRR